MLLTRETDPEWCGAIVCARCGIAGHRQGVLPLEVAAEPGPRGLGYSHLSDARGREAGARHRLDAETLPLLHVAS